MTLLSRFLVALVLITAASAHAQRASVVTPEEPVKLVKSMLKIPAHFANPMEFTPEVWLPEGFKAEMFAERTTDGYAYCRFLALDSNNVVHLAQHVIGKIYALIDSNMDGVCDEQRAVTPKLDSVHAMAFYKGALYATTPTKIIKCTDSDGDGFYETLSDFITDLPEPSWINHHARTTVFDEQKGKVYLGVGSLCDACRDPRPDHATILEFNDDGTGRRIFATGMRSTLGLAINPWTRELWGTSSGANQMGPQMPEELVTVLRDGGFYGYPYAMGNREFIPFERAAEYQSMFPITAADSERVRTMELPNFWLPAHSTPAQIHFYRGESFPSEYHKSGFVCVKGSWSARPARGYKVMRFWQENGEWKIGDFFSGFMVDTALYDYWARPIGAVEDLEGNMYFSFEGVLNSVIRVSYDESGDVTRPARIAPSVAIYPQPVVDDVTLRVTGFSTLDDRFDVELMDISGKHVISVAALRATRSGDAIELKLDLRDVPSGRYVAMITGESERISAPVVVAR